MWLLADEGMTPALGFSAPNRAYPVSTHVRALLAHLVFGAVVAAVTETAWRLLGSQPELRNGRGVRSICSDISIRRYVRGDARVRT